MLDYSRTPLSGQKATSIGPATIKVQMMGFLLFLPLLSGYTTQYLSVTKYIIAQVIISF